MPRPADVTDEMIAEWESHWPAEIRMMSEIIPGLREANQVGDWLLLKLSELGASWETIQRMASSFGHRAVRAEDKWELAREMVERYEAEGAFVEPTGELEDRERAKEASDRLREMYGL